MSNPNALSGPRASARESSGPRAWSYEEAFSRNLGLVTPEEQQKLRRSTVAIPGMGGVGGIHLMTLVRQGVGRFRIADVDTFEVANSNRQYGAEIDTLGRVKAEVMAEKARAVNPEVILDVLPEPIGARNVGRFLEGVDVVLDGIDFFSFDVRRVLFREAQERGIWAITAGPIGFSTAWLVFDPRGMRFDDYFDFHDGMAPLDQFAAFAMGLAPRGTHFSYIDLSYVDRRTARGPSSCLACNLAAAVAAVETIKILLGRKTLRPVPHYAQFDAYRGLLRQGRLLWGNRGPLQRLKTVHPPPMDDRIWLCAHVRGCKVPACIAMPPGRNHQENEQALRGEGLPVGR